MMQVNEIWASDLLPLAMDPEWIAEAQDSECSMLEH